MTFPKLKRLLYTYSFFDDFILIYPLYGVMFSDHGLNASQISSLFIVWSLTSFVLEVPSGSVADKYSRKNVLLFAQLSKAFAFLSWLLLPNYFGFLLGFLLWGVSTAFGSGTEEALVYDELKQLEQTKNYAKVMGTMSSLRLVSRIIGGFAAALFARSGYTIILDLSIISVVLSALPIYLLPLARRAEPMTKTKYVDYLKEGISLVLRNTKLLFIIGFAAVVTGLSAVDEYYDLFFKEKGFTNDKIAIAIGAVCLFGAIGSAIAHRLENKRIPLTASIFLGAGLLVGASLVPRALSAVMIGLYVGYIAIVTILFDVYAQAEATDKNRATMTSVKGLITEVFALMTFGIVALASQVRNYTFGLQMTALVIAIMAVAYGLLSKKYQSKAR